MDLQRDSLSNRRFAKRSAIYGRSDDFVQQDSKPKQPMVSPERVAAICPAE
jgi:hypothetical protein